MQGQHKWAGNSILGCAACKNTLNESSTTNLLLSVVDSMSVCCCVKKLYSTQEGIFFVICDYKCSGNFEKKQKIKNRFR